MVKSFENSFLHDEDDVDVNGLHLKKDFLFKGDKQNGAKELFLFPSSAVCSARVYA